MKLPHITLFQSIPRVVPLDRRGPGGRPMMQLIEPNPLGINGEKHWAPRGFIFDGSSTPWFSWPLMLPNDPRYLLPALWHDLGYAAHLWPRAYCDDLFLSIMITRDVPVWMRQIKYRSVQLCGGPHYKGNTPGEIALVRALGGIHTPSTVSPLVGAGEPVLELTRAA